MPQEGVPHIPPIHSDSAWHLTAQTPNPLRTKVSFSHFFYNKFNLPDKKRRWEMRDAVDKGEACKGIRGGNSSGLHYHHALKV